MRTRHFKLTIAYDGTGYGGWQRQPNVVTVQQLIEDAVSKIAGKAVTVHGSGRTDAGVHARAQVASCSLLTNHRSPVLHRALNANLPDDIRIVRVQEVAEDFMRGSQRNRRNTDTRSILARWPTRSCSGMHGAIRGSWI